MKQKKVTIQLRPDQTKYISYARWLCLGFQVLFIGYLISLMMMSQQSYQQMIQQNPILLAGFIVCLLNLYIWFQTKNMLEDLKAQKFNNYYRIFGCIIVFSQFLLFNYPSAILFAIGLKKCFQWKNSPFHNIMKKVKEEGKTSKFFINVTVLGFGILIALWFIAAFSKL